MCCRPQEGLFGLREWEEKGFVPEAVPAGSPYAVPPAGYEQLPGLAKLSVDKL
jgi:hypothetical protein